MMIFFTAYDRATGQVAYSGTADDPDALASDTLGILHGQALDGGWLADGVHHAQPAAPDPSHVFDWLAKQWHDPRTLQNRKDARWAAIKRARAAAFTAPLITPFGVFDADEEGQKNIERAVLLANNLTALGYPVAIDFTLHDNTIQVMDASAMVQVGLLLGGRVQLIRAQASALRAQIEAALDEAAVAACAWPA